MRQPPSLAELSAHFPSAEARRSPEAARTPQRRERRGRSRHMSGQIGVARGLIGLLYKEETASDAAVGLDNIVYRGDEVIKTAILSELSTKPLPAESRTPGLDLLLRRLRVFAVERLKLLGGESLKPPHERRAAAQTLSLAVP